MLQSVARSARIANSALVLLHWSGMPHIVSRERSVRGRYFRHLHKTKQSHEGSVFSIILFFYRDLFCEVVDRSCRE